MTSLDFAGCVCVDLAPMTPISKKSRHNQGGFSAT
jgi:hypothetical protein